MKKYPLFLKPIIKNAIWGGTSLVDRWGMERCGDNSAEAWTLSVREKEMSKITNGSAAGMTLDEYFRSVGYDSVSPDFDADSTFPLLIKFIDAKSDLSVQVHPDDAYAETVEKDVGKTEMWYIVEASEGAEIIYGLAEGVDEKAFKSAVDTDKLDGVMNRVKVKAGDCFFIPSGLLHAIGGGILIAEIQQNSDLTYRVYDYDRVDKNGNKRELHKEKAKDVTRSFTEAEIESLRYEGGREDGTLANSRYFKTYKINGERELDPDKSFISLLCIDGEGYIDHESEKYPVRKGDCVFLPRKMGKCRVFGGAEIICSEL